MIKNIFISSIIITIIFIYILKVPNLITNANKLIKEYYYDNFLNSLILDLILFQLYIFAGNYIIKLLKIKNVMDKTLIIALTTVIISSIFMFLFLNFSNKDLFFYRWFNKVGFLAVIYDLIIVTSVYMLSLKL
tara:strand:+ start:189 stop:587 length:399 start_codon:yes stop_codon:yes gene_type:complete